MRTLLMGLIFNLLVSWVAHARPNGDWHVPTSAPWATFRINFAGDPECFTEDGKNCRQLTAAEIAQANKGVARTLKPLSCGNHHLEVWGGSGYNSPGHWCSRIAGANATWMKATDLGLLDLVLHVAVSPEGDPMCWSMDGRNCAWGKPGELTPQEVSQSNPLICGAMHKNVWGGSGYEHTSSWCARLKAKFDARQPGYLHAWPYAGYSPYEGLMSTLGAWTGRAPLWDLLGGYTLSGSRRVTVMQSDSGTPDRNAVTVEGTPNLGDHANTVSDRLYSCTDYRSMPRYDCLDQVSDRRAATAQTLRDRDYVQGDETINAYVARIFVGKKTADVMAFPVAAPSSSVDTNEAVAKLDLLCDRANLIAVSPLSGTATSNTTPAGNYANCLVTTMDGSVQAAQSGTVYGNDRGARIKPDLVRTTMDGSSGSWSTAELAGDVAGYYGLLYSRPALRGALHSVVLRAAILNGASKSQLCHPLTDAWTCLNNPAQASYVWSARPPGQPLDRYYGFGRSHLFNTYTILTAGPYIVGQAPRTDGWRADHYAPGDERLIPITIDGNAKPAITLTFNRKVYSRQTLGTGTGLSTYMPKFSLELWSTKTDASGALVPDALLGQSKDESNNHQHIYLGQTPPASGLYIVKVKNNDGVGADTTLAAVAWTSARY